MPTKCTHCDKSVTPDEKREGARAICPECGNELPARKRSWKSRMMVPILILAILTGFFWLASNYIEYRKKSYECDASAKGAGRNMRLAEEVYYNDRNTPQGNYTDNLDILMSIDKCCLEDPGVTFSFLHVSSSYFTFFTQHAKGTGKTFVYHD